MEEQVKSRKRVMDHGEVLTGKREVNAMLDLVKHATERIESRFLEPACGNGNFLAVILERKLEIVAKRYKKSQYDYERYSIYAISSVYGIDILEDNVLQCRSRLVDSYKSNYLRLFGKRTKEKCTDAARYIVDRNIVWGDALSLKTVADQPTPIVFSEWALVNGSKFKRRDFAFQDLAQPDVDDTSLFAAQQGVVDSDDGQKGFIPISIREDYPQINFWELTNAK
jgi:hypothetical protein